MLLRIVEGCWVLLELLVVVLRIVRRSRGLLLIFVNVIKRTQPNSQTQYPLADQHSVASGAAISN